MMRFKVGNQKFRFPNATWMMQLARSQEEAQAMVNRLLEAGLQCYAFIGDRRYVEMTAEAGSEAEGKFMLAVYSRKCPDADAFKAQVDGITAKVREEFATNAIA